MNTTLTPLPIEKEPVRADGVKWFIGYMPVAMGGGGVEMEARPLPPLPDFSVAPSWAASTDPGHAANPFTGGFRPTEIGAWSAPVVPVDMPCAVEEGRTSYTDEDLHEVLAELMVSDEGSGGEVPVGATDEIAPLLRSAARRAVAEMVDPRMRSDVPLSFGRVCEGIKVMVTRWISQGSVGGVGAVRQVIGMQLFRKAPAELVISTGEIPLAAEEGILRVLENAGGRPEEPIYVHAGTQVYFLYGEEHVLAAIIQGEPDETMVEDLVYLLRRIEEGIGRRPALSGVWGASILSILQEGLLIRAPMGSAFGGRADTV